MIVLDHNIPEGQAYRLRRWRVRFRQVGFGVGRPEWDDQEEILRYLHGAKHVAFFTRDLGFFRRRLCHPNYCLVVLVVPVLQTALYIRQFLRHPAFKTIARRQGRVVKVSAERVSYWQKGRERLIGFGWQKEQEE